MWRRVVLVKPDLSEELLASIFKVERITQARKCYAVAYAAASNRLTLSFSSYFFYPEDGGDRFLQKSVFKVLHGATSQKT
jgi:hypothetical protein